MSRDARRTPISVVASPLEFDDEHQARELRLAVTGHRLVRDADNRSFRARRKRLRGSRGSWAAGEVHRWRACRLSLPAGRSAPHDPQPRRKCRAIWGHAEVRLQSTEAGIEIVLDDDGPGIPIDKTEEVFTPFFRLEGSRSSETGGVGLGLSIARASTAVISFCRHASPASEPLSSCRPDGRSGKRTPQRSGGDP